MVSKAGSSCPPGCIPRVLAIFGADETRVLVLLTIEYFSKFYFKGLLYCTVKYYEINGGTKIILLARSVHRILQLVY